MKILILLVIFFNHLNAVFLDINYEKKSMSRSVRQSEDEEFEPVTNVYKNSDNVINLNCDDFTRYAINCTAEAAHVYNSSRMSPPLPAKINDWCRAIRHLTNCALNWKNDCKDVTDSHFNEESVRGHIHVVNNICDDEWFLINDPVNFVSSTHICENMVETSNVSYQGKFCIGKLNWYEDVALCVESSTDAWEDCYINFKNLVEEQKNTTKEWTHYEIHFQLCCARARFRRCTLEALFVKPTQCTQEQAATLQKFSVIVSEGGVYQDCDRNMMYANCPGGDPRPGSSILKRLMSAEARSRGYKMCTTLKTVSILYFFIIILFKS